MSIIIGVVPYKFYLLCEENFFQCFGFAYGTSFADPDPALFGNLDPDPG